MPGWRTFSSRFSAPVKAVAVLLCSVALMAACGDSEPEPTVEELLELVEGRTLTSTEVDQKLGVGETLCNLDNQVLEAVWQQLSEDQLLFQDFVVAQLCPDRSLFYAGQTGRYVTEEAEESGIVPSSIAVPTSTVTGPSDGLSTTPPSAAEPSDLELTPTSEITPDATGNGSITPLEDSAPSGQIGPTTVPDSADAGE